MSQDPKIVKLVVDEMMIDKTHDTFNNHVFGHSSIERFHVLDSVE